MKTAEIGLIGFGLDAILASTRVPDEEVRRLDRLQRYRAALRIRPDRFTELRAEFGEHLQAAWKCGQRPTLRTVAAFHLAAQKSARSDDMTDQFPRWPSLARWIVEMPGFPDVTVFAHTARAALDEAAELNFLDVPPEGSTARLARDME